MSPDEHAIRDLVSRWMSASRSGDHQTVLSLMTDDVVFMVPGQEPFGKEAFKAATLAPQSATVDGAADIVELQVLGDWAYMRNKLRVIITPPNAAPIVKTGYTLTLLRKDAAGHWAIARDANLLTTDKK